MSEHLRLDDAELADMNADGSIHEVAADVAFIRAVIANVAFLGSPRSGSWVLVDAGIPGTARLIERAAARRFGAGHAPSAIVLTHGHFDHAGALEGLLEQWDAPVYAHPFERPYLEGRAAYPPPDPSVGGGLISSLSRFFPRKPIDIRSSLQDIQPSGELPV